MKDWLATLDRLLRGGDDTVRVCMAAVRGSAPREAGACMLVTAAAQHGTIGGGHLEFLAARIARDMLSGRQSARIDRMALGAALGQCCGGAVDLWFERFEGRDAPFVATALAARADATPLVLATTCAADRVVRRELLTAGSPAWLLLPHPLRTGDADATLLRDPSGDRYWERLDLREQPLWIFGAGHVAGALVPMLAPLPFALTWIDSRAAAFAAAPDSVRCIVADAPEDEVAGASDAAMFLVMTHSHDQDFAICRALLRRERLAWAGLIGSASKRTRFRQRLEARGVAAADFARITCPIGLPGLPGKRPAEIAIAVAAQVLQVAQALRAAHDTSQAASA